MGKKRILLVGWGNHQLLYNYADWLKKYKEGLQIDILSFNPIETLYVKYYDNAYWIKYNNLFENIISKIKGLRLYYRFHKYSELIKKIPEYDYIHFHYLSVDSYFLIKILSKNPKNKLILTIWGSDMYRLNPNKEKRFINICRLAHLITFTNKKSLEYFSLKYNWNRDNLKLCRFGLAPLENLKNLNITKSDCKNKLNWNTGKLAITIGYNMSPGQQHLKVLNQFKNDKILRLKDNIQLIVPITYGGNLNYKKQILDSLSLLPFEYKVYDYFLDDETVALIRKASDILIQLQVTDQFSGSMQEHLFAQNVVITGDWLPYETMKEKGAWFLEIDNIESLGKVILDVIHNFKTYEQKTINNSSAILELSSWGKNIKTWLALYNL